MDNNITFLKSQDFDYLKNYINNQSSLLKKLKLIYFLQDFNIYNYFKTKLNIPANYKEIIGPIPISDDNYTFHDLIYNLDIKVSDKFFIKPVYDCLSKYDIKILEWWVNSGLVPAFHLIHLKTEYHFGMNDFANKIIYIHFLIDSLEKKIQLEKDKFLTIDTQVLDWYLKMDFNLFFTEYSLNWLIEHQKTNVLNWWFSHAYILYKKNYPSNKISESHFFKNLCNTFIDKSNAKFIISQMFKFKKFKSFLFLLHNNINIHIKLYDLLLMYFNNQKFTNVVEFLLQNKHLFPQSLEKKHLRYLFKKSDIPDIKTLFQNELDNFDIIPQNAVEIPLDTFLNETKIPCEWID